MLIEKNFDFLIFALAMFSVSVALLVVFKRKHFINWFIVILTGSLGNFMYYIRDMIFYGRELADLVYLFSIFTIFTISILDYYKYVNKEKYANKTYYTIFLGIFLNFFLVFVVSYLLFANQSDFVLMFILLFMFSLLVLSIIIYSIIIIKDFTIMKLLFYLAIFSLFLSNFSTILSFIGPAIFWDFSYVTLIGGLVFFISCSLTVIFEDKFIEVSEELNLKENILHEQKKVSTIVNGLNSGFLVLDTKGTIILLNSKIKHYFISYCNIGIDIGANIFSLEHNKLIEALKFCFSKFEDFSFDLELSSDFILNVTCSKTSISELANDKPFSLIIEFHDITSFVQLNKLRSSFISMVSHELRSPISAINMSIQNIIQYSDKITSEENERLKNIIAKNSNVMTDIIEDLLLVSQLDEKKLLLKMKTFSLANSIKNVLLQLEGKSSAKNIAINFSCDSEIVLQADELRIEQVLRILIDNAIKYSYDGGAVNVDVEKVKNDLREWVAISVKDFGRGIKEIDINNLFQRFYRSNDVKNIQGTGLGLTIAKEITELHKGNILVDSKFGQGSNFTVYLPLASA